MIIIAAVVVIVLLVFWAISIHNNIIRASNKCDNAWAAIDTQLQRRNDLIPNLVNTVKGYAAHESKTFEAVTSARAAVANARTPEEKMQASGTLSNALTNLFAVVENYQTIFLLVDVPHVQASRLPTSPLVRHQTYSSKSCFVYTLYQHSSVSAFLQVPSFFVCIVTSWTKLVVRHLRAGHMLLARHSHVAHKPAAA